MEIMTESTINSDHWHKCLRHNRSGRDEAAVLHAEIDRRCFWASLEWAETGEAPRIGGFFFSGLRLYWDPIRGLTGDQVAIDIITNFWRTHP